MRFYEFLSEANLSPKELFKYRGHPKKDRIPLFLKKLQSESPFLVKTKNGDEEIILDPNEYDRMKSWIENPTSSIKLKSRDNDRFIPLTAIKKTKEFGGEDAGQRERIEQGQIEGISQDLENAKQGAPFVELLVGDKIVRAATVEKERGSIFGRAPKSDMTVLDENGKAVAWVSLKDKTFRWGGWQHLHKVPEINDWLDRVRAVTGSVFESGQAFGLHISDDIKQKIVYGKNFGEERGFSNVDAVLIGWANIEKKGDQFVLISDTVYKNGDIPSGPHSPYIVLRFMNNRNDLGFKNVRAETNTISEGRRVKWLDSDNDVINVQNQVASAPAKKITTPIKDPVNDIDNNVNNKKLQNIKVDNPEINKEKL
jgi:hypothetical protein